MGREGQAPVLPWGEGGLGCSYKFGCHGFRPGVGPSLKFFHLARIHKIVACQLVRVFFSACYSYTGAGNITSHRLREYEVRKLQPPASCRQKNAILLPRIHATDGR